MGDKLVPGAFLKKIKLSKSLDQQSDIQLVFVVRPS